MDRNRFKAQIPRLLLALLVLMSLRCVLEAQFGPLLSPAQAPQARSQEELDAYLTITTATEAHEVVKAADSFASRFPKSELAGIAYQYQMRAFEQLDDFDGMLAAGERALLANPDNLNTLLTLAPAMANRAVQRPDSASLLARAEDYAHRALQGIERTQIPGKIPLEHWELEKQEMQSEAHEALGVVALRRGQSKTAVEEFQTAIRLAPNAQGVKFLGLGMAYASTGARENAEKALRRAVELGPEPVRKLGLNELEKLNSKESARK